MKKTHRGFTLIELLVTISIIAILMGMIVPVFSTMRNNARISKAKVGAKNLETAFRAYLDDKKVWTGLSEGSIDGDTFNEIKEYFEFDTLSIEKGMAVDPWYDPDDNDDQVYQVKFDNNYDNQIENAPPDNATVYRPVIVWTEHKGKYITSWD